MEGRGRVKQLRVLSSFVILAEPFPCSFSAKSCRLNSDAYSSSDYCRTICRPHARSTDFALVLQLAFHVSGRGEEESKIRIAMMCPTFGRTHQSTCRSSNSIFEARGSEIAKFERCDVRDKLARTQEALVPSCFPTSFSYISAKERERNSDDHDVSDA